MLNNTHFSLCYYKPDTDILLASSIDSVQNFKMSPLDMSCLTGHRWKDGRAMFISSFCSGSERAYAKQLTDLKSHALYSLMIKNVIRI